jgi:hypothetical protein
MAICGQKPLYVFQPNPVPDPRDQIIQPTINAPMRM